MNAKETRIQIINIQEQHCRRCEYLFGSYQHCIENCEWGKAVYQLRIGVLVQIKDTFQKAMGIPIGIVLYAVNPNN
ncbi:hypothetical protein [Bacillus thuringiensis]|uniref:Uncharacterized protein n=1 Tax=Bacillus thuringiensis Bt18247 TaxID=1423143 RepID=A0A9W3SZ81_BACTU|nr:hypothetical protein [Bacillus thuringiensis]AOM14291.1 hypothetical protein BTI247_59610 [Bacillus thuringiensis Bt18247]MBG9529320.1 hypothetical protein [Bacillus thuringiensis]